MSYQKNLNQHQTKRGERDRFGKQKERNVYQDPENVLSKGEPQQLSPSI